MHDKNIQVRSELQSDCNGFCLEQLLTASVEPGKNMEKSGILLVLSLLFNRKLQGPSLVFPGLED